MEPTTRPSFQPAGAGGVLLGAIMACAAIGALVGWALGSAAVGTGVGAAVGIPVGVFSVYRRYRSYFT